MKWYKELSASDAQQEGGSANMALRLTKGSLQGPPLEDHTTWFRDTFFDALSWTPAQTSRGNPCERASCPFHVVIGDTDLGNQTLDLDHDLARAGHHRGPTTYIHFNAVIKNALEDVNLTGHKITLGKAVNNTYAMHIEPPS